MEEQRHSIFREQAIRRYLKSRDEAVLPRFISPPVRQGLWLLLALLIAFGAVSWFARIPVYGTGEAVVISTDNVVQHEILVAAFLPAHHLTRLRAGQRLFLPLDNRHQRLSGVIMSVAREIISPAAARRQLSLPADAGQGISQPSAVVFARLIPSELPAAAYAGRVYPVSVEIGSRRAISLLPIIGQTYGE
jgi:hypothetical protein